MDEEKQDIPKAAVEGSGKDSLPWYQWYKFNNVEMAEGYLFVRCLLGL